MQQYPQGPQGYPYQSPYGDAPGTPGAQPQQPQQPYSAPPAVPTVYPPADPYGYGYSYTPPPSYPVYYSPDYQSAKNKAVTSMVLGIIGLTIVPFICSIIALALGAGAKKTLGRNMDGYGMAQAGFVMGIIGTSLYGLPFLVLFLGLL